MRRFVFAGFIAACLSFPLAPAHAAINSSPVVQLVSYSDQYGIHVNMLGWGSASIINDQGVILSNNHVVDTGNGTLASAFSVCITKAASPRPVCDYTASLIERDSDMDIALLKIDPVDVHGKAVNYGDFAVLLPDFSYEPATKDNVLITGYPWIGADTITETRGIVSGVTDYNGYKYIKTDAVIAGGNSGGAMISEAGKLIGVPTFTMGGMMDNALGYGLLIKEAQAFIEENISRTPAMRSISIDFPAYRGFLDNINTAGSISDDLLQFNFPTDYKISNYIKNRGLLLEPKTQRDIAIMELNIGLIQTPELKTEKAYMQHLEKEGYYSPHFEQLIKKTIGGITMLQPVQKGDITEGQMDFFTQYFAQISPRLALQITVVAPLYDEKNHARIQEEITRVLAELQIKPSVDILESSFQFTLQRPKIRILSNDTSYMDEFSGTFSQPLATPSATARASVMQMNLYNGKGKSVEEIIAAETVNVNQEYVQPISFQGSDGYIACQSTSGAPLPNVSNNEMNFNFMQYFGMNSLTEERKCTIRLLSGISDNLGGTYSLKIDVSAPTNSIQSAVDDAFAFMEAQLQLGTESDTSLKNPYIELAPLAFTDLEDQGPEYLELLRKLVQIKALDNTELFNPYRPTKWKEFIGLYVRLVYDVQPEDLRCKKGNLDCYLNRARINTPHGTKSLSSILGKLNIPMEDYAPANQNTLSNFDLLFKAALAEVQIGNNSDADLMAYQNTPSAARFAEADAALKDLEDFLYDGAKVTLMDLELWGSFSATKDIVYTPGKGLSTSNWFSDKPVTFTMDSSSTHGQTTLDLYEDNQKRYGQAYKELKECSKDVTKIAFCAQQYTAKLAEFIAEDNEKLLSFSVLTRAFAYDFVVHRMDFSKFDESLR